SLGGRNEIPLREEMALVESFLSVEQVRFGARLLVDRHVAPEAEECLVPPLVLQPLVENAVNHGIAGLLDGGTVRIEARRSDGRLEIFVENPCDPDRAPGRGPGVGLANVKARLAALHAAAARVEVREEPDRPRVALSLPVVLAESRQRESAANGGTAEARAGAVGAVGAGAPARNEVKERDPAAGKRE